jgi:hypothetical protein
MLKVKVPKILDGLKWFRTRSFVSFYEHGNATSGSIRAGNLVNGYLCKTVMELVG